MAGVRRGQVGAVRGVAVLSAALASWAVLSSASLAQERPQSLAMTCRQAIAFVRARGPVVLGTGGPTFDKFVRAPGLCDPDEIAQQSLIPTRDTPVCPIGFRCLSEYDRY